MIDVNEDRGRDLTVATITGANRDEVERGLDRYFSDFRPEGYATEVRVNPFEVVPGRWKTVVVRSSSAD